MMLSAVIFLGIVAVSSAAHECWSGHRHYVHGQRFTLPGYSHCLRYLCWDGQVTLEQEACEVENQCHPVGSVFEHSCTQYHCTKEDHGTHHYYVPKQLSSRCADHNGGCHSPGSTFPYIIRGKYYNSCTCTISGQRINYRCYSRRTLGLLSGQPAATQSVNK